MADQAALQERVNAQLGTLGNLWDAATGTFTNAMVNFGEAIAPEIKAITEWIAELSERLGNWAKKNPELSNTLMRIAAITSVVAIAFGGLSLAVAALLGPMAIMKLIFGVLGVTFGSLLGAVAAILAPLAALAVLGVTIIKLWEPISAFFSGLWQGIMTGLAPVFEAFKPFAPLLDGISSGVKTLSGWFGDLLEPIKFSKETLEGFGSAGQIVGRILGEAFNLALTPLKAFLSGIEWLLESLGILETKKIPKFDIPTASTPGYLTGNYNQPAMATGYGPTMYQPPKLAPARGGGTTQIHAPISIVQQPGQSGADVAQEVSRELDRRERMASARTRASLRDTN